MASLVAALEEAHRTICASPCLGAMANVDNGRSLAHILAAGFDSYCEVCSL